ncbi:T9SS type A sorting domain-containing protein [Candidatus Micrarchaeota archaeon]|nr:T9SS type A sorting domain-containing protein [Candidatus Micrarchaeota archaeon]
MKVKKVNEPKSIKKNKLKVMLSGLTLIIASSIAANQANAIKNNQPMVETYYVNENKKIELKVSPNPANSTINIEVSNVYLINKIVSIYNDKGRLMFRTQIDNNRIDISQLPSGKYIIIVNGFGYDMNQNEREIELKKTFTVVK